MLTHVAVFLIMLASAYLAVAFGGIPGDWVMLVPPAFLIYLAAAYLLRKRSASKERE